MPRKKRIPNQRLAEGPLYQHLDETYECCKNKEGWMQRLEQVVVEWNAKFGTCKDPKKELSTYLHARANHDNRNRASTW